MRKNKFTDFLDQTDERNFKIRDAALRDGICNYTFEITKGVGYGDVHNVKGTALFLDDLSAAFTKFNVHLAFIDDAFKHAGIEVTDIDQLHGHELTFLYSVTGFQVKGNDENEGIVLKGVKHVSNGRIDIQTPKIMLDEASSYKWYNELKTAAVDARNEVALYKEGKCEVIEEAVEPDKTQMSIFGDGIEVGLSVKKGKKKNINQDLDEDFANAAL